MHVMNVHAVFRPLAGLAAAIALAALAPGARAQDGPPSCALPPEFFVNDPPLARSYAALAAGEAVVIVAIGGASTLGRAAGPPDLAWPARLAAALAERFPRARVTAINRGVPRQTAADMLQRFDRDVLAAKPTLVIWETGITDAVRGEDLDLFRDDLQDGIDRLRAADAEIVLMDMQFSRRAAAVINLERYRLAMQTIAEANDVPLFRRFDIMRDWAESGVFDFRGVERDQRQALARRLYDCVGRALAQMIATAAPPSGIPAAPSDGERRP